VDDQYITPAEAARILGTTKPRVARMIERGELPLVTRCVTVYRVRRADVERIGPLPKLAPGRPRKDEVARDRENGVKTP